MGTSCRFSDSGNINLIFKLHNIILCVSQHTVNKVDQVYELDKFKSLIGLNAHESSSVWFGFSFWLNSCIIYYIFACGKIKAVNLDLHSTFLSCCVHFSCS